MTDEIKKILLAATLAPSGENAQPWRSRLRGETIYLFNNPASDQSLYNAGQRGSYVACGCALENIIIAASSQGSATRVELLPDTANLNLVARINLSRAGGPPDPLAQYIDKRVTNRKAYEPAPLKEGEAAALSAAGDEVGFGKIPLTQDKNKIARLTAAGCVNEKVMFSNRRLHQFFFDHVNWNREEDAAKKVGFFIKTLELPPPARVLFPLIRQWRVMNWLNRHLKLNRQIAKQNAATYAKAAAVGIIAGRGQTPQDFVLAGRVMERLWLTATKLGLCLQPMTGMLFFMRAIELGQANNFSPEQLTDIRRAYQEIKHLFGLKEEAVIMMFRLGRGAPPTARARKFTVEDVMLPA